MPDFAYVRKEYSKQDSNFQGLEAIACVAGAHREQGGKEER